MQNGEIDPKMGKTDPDLKTRSWSGLVCKIDNIAVMIMTLVLIVLSYLTLRFYRCNYFYDSLEQEIVLTAICTKVVETAIQTCQHSIVNFQALKQLICRWPYLIFDGRLFLERRVVVYRGLYLC